jgi:heme A synthase
MQSISSSRARVALIFFAAVVVALVLTLMSHTAQSHAQTTGYGPQSLPDQVIKSSSSDGGSDLGVIVGAGTAIVIVVGAVGYGVHRNNADSDPLT